VNDIVTVAVQKSQIVEAVVAVVAVVVVDFHHVLRGEG